MSGRPILRKAKAASAKKPSERKRTPGAKAGLETAAAEELEAAKKLFGMIPYDPTGWSFHARWIPTKPPHGQEYVNVSYQVTSHLRLGLDWRPKTGDVTPLANLLVLSEGEEWYEPAIIAGLSNDDFNEVNSYATYATASKVIVSKDVFTLSGYAGATHIFELNTTRAVGGLIFRYDKTSLALQHSGVDLHATISQNIGQHTIRFLMFDLEKPGVAYSYRF